MVPGGVGRGGGVEGGEGGEVRGKKRCNKVIKEGRGLEREE